MMDRILNIVPYTGEHGIYIMKQQMNHPLMDKDMEFEGNAKNLEQDKLAFTGLVNGKPVFACRYENTLEWCCGRLGISN